MDDYANPKVIPVVTPRYYNPSGETPDLQQAYVFLAPVPPTWYDNRVWAWVPVTISEQDNGR